MEPEEDQHDHPVPGEDQGVVLHSLRPHVLCHWVRQKGYGTQQICIKTVL